MKYEIKGGAMPVVELRLDKGEKINCESGAMLWMNSSMSMATSTGGGFGKMFSKFISNEKVFLNTYTSDSDDGLIAFGCCFPGNIMAIELQAGQSIICQKSAYLASTEGVSFDVVFQKKIGTGFFGGEGFIMQRLTGPGLVFIEIDGSTIEYTLNYGEQMIIDTGHLAMMDNTCSIDVQMIKGVKNVLFGGEGLFNTIVTGPGKIVLQTMPKSALIANIASSLPSGGGD